MPFPTTTLVRFTAKLSRCLSLALLPALASEAHAVGQPQRKQSVPSAQPVASTPKASAAPYLAALGPLPLRFARPGIEPTDEPPASPEPKPVAITETPASTKDKPAAPLEEKIEVTKTPSNIPPLQSGLAPAPLSEFSEPYPQPALPILPDDTKRELRAEDVIPFFIYPTNANRPGDDGVRLIAPLRIDQTQPIVPPPSSATYQEK
jgi:hypothetical protein